MKRLLGASLMVTMLVTRVASADPDRRSATELAVAQALFDEGRAALDDGRIDEACDKLSRSLRLDPAGGTLLNLALCHEKQGRLATAWTEYTEGLALARRDKHDVRIAFAEEHIAAIEGTLPRLRLVVRDAAPDLVVRLDDVVLDRAAMGIAIPIDPGPHVVTASAPGKIAWRHDVAVKAGDRAELEVPELAVAAAPEVEVAAPNGRRTAGWITIAGGGVAIVTGAVFGGIALSKNATAKDLCPDDPCTNSEGARASDDAITFAWVANVTIGVGLVAAAVGTVLVLTSKPSANVSLGTRGLSVSF